MSDIAQTKKIGGEYGEVRANIDVHHLNAYFDKHVTLIKTPVEVKQFKVCLSSESSRKCHLTF